MTAPDLELIQSHGFYELRPLTDKGVQFVADFPAVQSFNRDTILLDSFFAFAGDWCRLHVMPHPSQPVMKWGDSLYSGQSGANTLWDECA